MEMGYSSLDLAMLLIAAFVIWVASRIPLKPNGDVKKSIRQRLKNKNQHSHSIS
jgi:hypothetical protein